MADRDLDTELAEIEKTDIDLKLERLDAKLTDLWGHSEDTRRIKNVALKKMAALKTGMYASIPIICKQRNCPYKQSCHLIDLDLAPHGEACPIEAAQVEIRLVEYIKDFSLDMDHVSFTDRNIVSEIINLDILADRTKRLMQAKQNLIIDVVSGITEGGDEYTHPEIAKEFELYERILRKRNDMYSLMMGTRKDNKNDKAQEKTIIQIISDIESGKGFVVNDKPPIINAQ